MFIYVLGENDRHSTKEKRNWPERNTEDKQRRTEKKSGIPEKEQFR